MTTIIPCAAQAYRDSVVTLLIEPLPLYADRRVLIEIRDGIDALVINPTRADLLAAIETELNVRFVEATS